MEDVQLRVVIELLLVLVKAAGIAKQVGSFGKDADSTTTMVSWDANV